MKKSLIIADDNAVLTANLKEFFASVNGYEVVAVAEKHELKIVVRYSQKIEFVCARGKISYCRKTAFVHGERHYGAVLFERINRGAVAAHAKVFNGHNFLDSLYFVGISSRYHRKSPAFTHKLLDGGDICGRNTRKTVLTLYVNVFVACQRKVVIAAQ